MFQTGDGRACCELCGEPMPEGEDMFKFHGYSGPCPKPPLPRKAVGLTAIEEIAAERAKLPAKDTHQCMTTCTRLVISRASPPPTPSSLGSPRRSCRSQRC